MHSVSTSPVSKSFAPLLDTKSRYEAGRNRFTVSDAVTSECSFGECTRSWSGLRRRVVKQREEGPARPRASRADDDGPDTRPLQMSWQEGYDAKMLFNLQ